MRCQQPTHLIPHPRTVATQPPRPRKEGPAYPENLNIFNSGFLPMYVHMLTRITSSVLLATGTFWAINTLFDPTTPNYMVPIFALGSAVPLLASGLSVGGFVHHINILLPSSARRSKDALINFVDRVPPNTRLQIKSFWFRPWAHVRLVEFRDLRRLPSSRLRITNLEQLPLYGQKAAEDAKRHPALGWVARSWMGRYYVSTDQVRDKSRAPGVWNTMWQQIPVVGQEQLESAKGDRNIVRRVKVSAHQSPSSTAAKKPPPAKSRP